MKQIALGIVIVIGTFGTAFAAPPASCRDKFVGTWKYFGGSTVIRPDGTAIPSIGVKYQTWTCNGNQYIFSNPDGQTWTSTLSADGNKLVGAGTATRVGALKKKTAPVKKEKTKTFKVGKPKLVRSHREKGFESCTKYTVSDKDYQVQARMFKQDPPHQWNALVSASSNCNVPIVFNACFTFHGLQLPEQRGGGEHFIGAKGNIKVSYYSSGFPRDGSYSYNIRFCQHGMGPCKVSCP